MRSMIPDDAPRAASLEVTCKVCDSTAMRMQLFEPVNAHDKPYLMIDGFLNHIETVVDADAFAPLKAAPRCSRSTGYGCLATAARAMRFFCRGHWTTETLFDDGFYDCIRGTCPSGHTRTVDD